MSIVSTVDYLNGLVSKYKVKAEKLSKSIEYLHRYGYLVKSGEIKDYTVAEILDGVKKFQDLFGVDVDGEIGPQTLRAMDWPRCGRPDFEEQREDLRRWRKKELSIYVQKSISGYTRDAFEKLLFSYLPEIEKVCGLKFSIASRQTSADIVIGAGRGRSADFDGPSGTLAYAYLPGNEFDGQLRLMFDDDETWITDPRLRGILLMNVFLHEIGHNLGLSHSQVRSALMAPYYSPSIAVPQQNDDIPRLQTLYGKPVVTPVPDPEPEPNDPPLPPPSETSIITLEVQDIKKIEIPGYRITKMG